MRRAKNKGIFKTAIMMAAAALFAIAAAIAVYSASDVRTVEQKMTEEGLILYLAQGGDEGPVSVRIGTEILDAGTITNVGREYPMATWLLVDNSLSISAQDRTNTNQMLTNLVAGKAAKEQFNLCTYDEELRILVENSSDYSTLKTAIDGIEYLYHSTYLLDALGKILEDSKNFEGYTRVVVIGDGTELNPNGLTRDEIEKAFDEDNIPVYVFGCKNDENIQQLNEMYSLSRLTGAESWTLSELDEPLSVVSRMGAEEIPFKVEIDIPEELKDGTTKGILLTYADGSTVSTQVTMPFGEIVEAAPETKPTQEHVSDSETASNSESEPEAAIDPVPEPKSGSDILIFVLIGAGILFAVLAAVIIFLLVQRAKNKERIMPVNGIENNPVCVGRGDERGDQHGDTGGITQILVESDRNLRICLTDKSNGGRRMEAPLRGSVTIGRGGSNQIVLDYDRTVSNRHCEIFVSGNTFMIRDLNSSNGTYVDGRKVVDQTEISNGSVIKLGKLELEVEIR